MQIQKQRSLKEFSSIKIGGPADIFIPETIDELIAVIKDKPQAVILGGGTNILFPDEGISRPVILTTKLTGHAEEGGLVKVGAGYKIGKLFDFAKGVAVTAGGSVSSNFGAYGFEISSYVEKVRLLTKDSDEWVSGSDLEFSYRNCQLPAEDAVIAEVVFNKRNEQVEEHFQSRRIKQPLDVPSLGSIFKNPPDNYAGKLIEECGFKGSSQGDAFVWDQHANFILNKGEAKNRDVKILIEKIREKVKEKFDIDLELEIKIIK
jgi:UDP-N-acetylmuramate dehydrogenase